MTPGEADDPRLDALFDLAPEEFVAARDDLARTLRAEGDRTGAAAVKKLRRPTVVAWALNQLVRRDPDALTELLAAADELRQAQRKVLSGLGPKALREAGRLRRSVVDRLTDRVAGVLRERGNVPEAHVAAVRRALEAASVDAGTATELRAARLSTPPEPESGFGDVAGLLLVPDDTPAGTTDAAAGEGGLEDGAVEEAERQREEAERQHAEAERQREEAERQHAEAERQRERAAERLEAASAAAVKARAEARERRREAEEATRDAEAAGVEVDRLLNELEEARAEARRSRDRAEQAEAAAREAAALAGRREQERAEARDALDRLGNARSAE